MHAERWPCIRPRKTMKKIPQVACQDCEHRDGSLFCDLAEGLLTNIDEHKTSNLYKKGQIIFYEGNRPMGLFCLQGGKVKIYKTGAEGKEQIVRFAKPGDFLGYRALISDESYTASAAALEECKICLIDRNVFFNLLETDRGFNWKMMQQLGRELREAEDFMTDIAQKTVRERVAEMLLVLRAKYGCEENSKIINASLSREELASYVGTATETLIRLLSEFKSDGVIETSGQKISILHPEKLLKIANIEH